MKRHDPTSPVYLSFCLIVRHAAQTLEYALRSIRERAPDSEIVVVDTCSSDDSGLDVFFDLKSWKEKQFSDAEVQTRLDGAGLKLLFVDEHAAGPGSETDLSKVSCVRLRVVLSDGAEILPSLWPEAVERTKKALDLVSAVEWQRGPSTVEIAKAYADVFEVYRGPRGDWNEAMHAFDDAAAARNRSFELAHGVWKAWIDADDKLCDAKESEHLLRLNGCWPEPDGATLVDGKSVVMLEDVLRWFEKEHPEVEQIYCPNWYRGSEDGHAVEWQDRERFIRNTSKYEWREAAHEIYVPKLPSNARPPGQIPTLCIKHLKRWTQADAQYSLDRHYAILIKEYEAGRRTARALRYLENFSRFKCPGRREEFILGLHAAATNPLDRYVACLREGDYQIENGFFHEGMASYAAATYHAPAYPDAYFRGACALRDVEQFALAGEWFRKGLACQAGLLNSEVAPRDQKIRYRLEAADALRFTARDYTRRNNHAAALSTLDEAVRLVDQVRRDEIVVKSGLSMGPEAYYRLISNEAEAIRRVTELYRLWKYLVANDETQKAVELLKIVPHNLQDHPLVVEIERWSQKVVRHLTDEKAFQAFYENDAETGAVATEDLPPGVAETTGKRADFIIEYLKKHNPSAKVLEVGTHDGSTGLPLLRALPGLDYVAYDVNRDALARFERNARKEFGDALRFRAVHGYDMNLAKSLGDEQFDAVVFLEVIEHVADPVESVRNLLARVKPGGRLFISTPWGAFDNGAPYNLDRRDPRGHVRAMTLRDAVDVVETAGGRVEHAHGNQGVMGFATCLSLVVQPGPKAHQVQYRKRPITFVVAGALWEWNASEVLANGIGASEETIVYLARKLAAEGHPVEVYGPIPRKFRDEEEVHSGVKYWPREQLRKIRTDSLVIVSRAPGYGTQLDKIVGTRLDKVLWLQDTIYDDLNAQVAAQYEKIVVLTEWHKQLTHQAMGVPLDKMDVIGNFLLPEHFRTDGAPVREPHHFIYCSSPDRGLVNLLRMWPEFLRRWPDATLDVFYGWKGAMKLGSGTSSGWAEAYREQRQQFMQLRYQQGVYERGMVNHQTIAREMQRASVWTYPTTFDETFCSNAIKARAAGCIPVTTQRAGLAETAACAETFFVEATPGDFGGWTKRFVDAVERATETSSRSRKQLASEAQRRYSLDAVYAACWKPLLRSLSC